MPGLEIGRHAVADQNRWQGLASMTTKEHSRLQEIRDDAMSWRRWGPYVLDRSWGGVREDYSPDGNAWDFLSFDKAASKAYRWGEDGIAGICDRYQLSFSRRPFGTAVIGS